jgi:hypothetical protein
MMHKRERVDDDVLMTLRAGDPGNSAASRCSSSKLGRQNTI